ncbi:MAG: hypothetical protein WAT39_02350 [Planctomycetota bacterium]
MAQNVVWSTHDWTISLGFPVPPFAEQWVDVKMPGGFPQTATTADSRRTYVVGTVVAQSFGTPTSPVQFSNFDAHPANLTPPLPSSARQVVMLQCNNTTSAGSSTQAWQRFFFGAPSTSLTFPQPNTARAVAVWEADAPTDRRIAICGETYDPRVEFSQSGAGWSGATGPGGGGQGATGFIAVYDGFGNVSWTHHFFSNNNPNPNVDTCTITDISIRVDAQGRETVTYCGVFTHGNPGLGSELSPERPYPAPSSAFSGGDTTQAPGRFDGFVGRLVRYQGTTTRVFHSIVGGPGNDGLFGLCEINENEFAVVGATEIGSTTPAGRFFPIGLSGPGTWSVGAVLTFDARATTQPTGRLVLVGGNRIGSWGGPTNVSSFACDVSLGRNVVLNGVAGPCDMLYVVGTTDDPALSTDFLGPATAGWQVLPPTAQSVMQGPTDGFISAFAYIHPTGAAALMQPWTYSYWGAPGNDGLTGVNNWNEWSDQVGVVGYTTRNGTQDIATSTLFFNTSYISLIGTGNFAFANGTEQLHLIREAVIAGPDTDTPAALPPFSGNATVGYPTISLGGARGGGIAMGNDGRTNVVGASAPPLGVVSGYPPAGGGRLGDAGIDAVRTELDMLPMALVGVGRTDGTGFQVGAGPYPGTASGGTTPACALSAFGVRIGSTAPVLQRMLIDYQGPAPAPGVNTAAVVVSRPTVQPNSVTLSALQIGLPPATPWAIPSGTEFWLGDPNASNLLMLDAGQANQPLRFRMPAFPSTPPGATSLSVQAASLLVTPIGSGACSSLWSASPAIFFTY